MITVENWTVSFNGIDITDCPMSDYVRIDKERKILSTFEVEKAIDTMGMREFEEDQYYARQNK